MIAAIGIPLLWLCAAILVYWTGNRNDRITERNAKVLKDIKIEREQLDLLAKLVTNKIITDPTAHDRMMEYKHSPAGPLEKEELAAQKDAIVNRYRKQHDRRLRRLGRR